MSQFAKTMPRVPLWLALVVGTQMTGCSDIYYDRRDAIVPSVGDALAANKVTQMIDPWPLASAKRDIAFNGEKMQTASERYRQGRVIPPANATTSSAAYQQAAQQAAAATAAAASPAPASGWATTPKN